MLTASLTIQGGGKRRAVIMHLADENNKLSQQRKISPTALVYRCEALAGANLRAAPCV